MFSSYAVILLSAIIWLSHCQEADNDNGSSSMANFFDILIPVEQLPSRGNSRAVEWYKYFKMMTQVKSDLDMKMSKKVTISRNLVGDNYTISAILAAEQGDSVYLLRRRQDVYAWPNEFDSDGTYNKLNEGAIPVDCVLHFNLTDGSVISSRAKDIFYYPNAMTRDPQDNFWFSDAARHQVMRMNKGEARPSLSIGKQFAPGKETGRLCAPTDIAVTTNHVFVADGLCNNRVVMFRNDGTYVAEFGNAARPGLFNVINYDGTRNQLLRGSLIKPAAIAVDEQADRLYVSDSGQARVLLVKAGLSDSTALGTTIRTFKHSDLQPVAGRIALDKRSPTVFMINSYSTVYLHRGFTFNTHDTTFKGAWGPDDRGFVRPRALAVSDDGSRVYVTDATEQSPESIWIFNRGESSRSRRHVGFIPRKGSSESSPRTKPSHRLVYMKAQSPKGLHSRRLSSNVYSSSWRRGNLLPSNKWL